MDSQVLTHPLYCIFNFLVSFLGTVMCFGQTGAGKTYTMTGSTESYRQRGIIPRALQEVNVLTFETPWLLNLSKYVSYFWSLTRYSGVSGGGEKDWASLLCASVLPGDLQWDTGGPAVTTARLAAPIFSQYGGDGGARQRGVHQRSVSSPCPQRGGGSKPAVWGACSPALSCGHKWSLNFDTTLLSLLRVRWIALLDLMAWTGTPPGPTVFSLYR